MPPFKDLSGQTFGYLYVIEPTPKRKGSNRVFRCRCLNCGKIVELPSGTIAHSQQISCGCIKNRNLTTKPIADKLGQVDGTNVSRISSDKTPRKYIAYIYFKGERYHLYYGTDKNKAIAARKEAEQRLFGEFLTWYNAQKDTQK